MLAEPLLLERDHSGAKCSGKALLLLALLIGLGLAIIVSTQEHVLESGTTLAFLASAPGLQGTVPGFARARASPAMSSSFGAWSHSRSQGLMTQDRASGRLRGVQAYASSNDEPYDMAILSKRIAELKEREDGPSDLSGNDKTELKNRMTSIAMAVLKNRMSLPSNDMAILEKRMGAMQERQAGMLNITVSDTIPLPGQRITLTLPCTDNQVHVLDRIGVLGIWPPESGKVLPLGTEMKVTAVSVVPRGVQVELMGIRRFQVEGDLPNPDGLFAIAHVEFIADSPLGDKDEVTPAALIKSNALGPLVDEWIELVREGGFEQQPLHVSTILSELGPIPPVMEPARRAMWVCALVNPTPALGVANEVRPALLTAQNNAEMLSVATYALTSSIETLKRRIDMAEQPPRSLDP